MTYLILHKVRGEPAFDIAEMNDDMGTPSDPGPWWIVPTSGHRAYPSRYWKLEDLFDGSGINENGWHDKPTDFSDLDPDLPDHYTINSHRPPSTLSATELLGKLGILAKPVPAGPPMVRRV